jgi:hypothetical protein
MITDIHCKNIQIIEIRMAALPGVNIGDALRDALTVAVNEWRNVRLRHNSTDYLIKISDLLTVVTKERSPPNLPL